MNRKSGTLAAESAKNYMPDEKARPGFYAQAVAESLVPIRPGVPGKAPFWNSHAHQFTYAPALDFQSVPGASHYRFTATSVTNKKDFIFEAAEPWAPLTSIWKDLPVGEVVLKVDGLDRKGGAVLGSCGAPRKFWRAAVFHGPYHEAARPYMESARMSLRYLFALQAVQVWKDGGPDPADPAKLLACYGLYQYSSKMFAAVIQCAAMHMALNKGNKDGDEALRVLNHAFDYSMRISEPSNAPLAYLPPTYRGRSEDQYNHPGQIMMSEPTCLANAYLDAYELTGDKRFLEEAQHIADTYSKTQLPNGTWPLMMDMKTGKGGAARGGAALLIPTKLIQFLDHIERLLGRDDYGKMRKAALAWLMENPMRTFDWRGQFEDIEIDAPYVNQTPWGAINLAIYLFEHKGENKAYRGQAEDLLRFAEDQFVVWETGKYRSWYPASNSVWRTSCAVMEQYVGASIDASAASMIKAYQRAYLATGDSLHLAKATALANAMTMAQDAKTGNFPTYWVTNLGDWWINCAVYSTQVMFDFARMTAEKR